MLEKFRRSVQTIYAKILIVVIIASFAFWGVGGMIRSSTQNYAIKVGDFKVSPSAFQNEVSKTRNFYRNYYGQALSEDVLNTIPFGQITANRLVNHYLFLQEAKNLNIEISDNTVFSAIYNNENYQTDGKFDKMKFQSFLDKNGISEAYYINYVKEYESANLLQSLFQTYTNDYDAVAKLLIDYYNQEKQVDIYKIGADNIANKNLSISETELIEYHAKNTSDFIKPEARSVHYVDLSCKNMEKFIHLTDSEIQADYDSRSSDFTIAEVRDIKQLFFNDEVKAQEALSLATQGSSIKDLAVQYGIDDAIVNIGEVSKDQVMGDFADAIFATDKGKFSTIVKGPIGYHVFYIANITPAKKQPLSVVKEQVASNLTKQKACKMAYDTFNKVEADIASGTTLDEIAYNYQLDVQSNDSLMKDVESFGSITANYPAKAKEIIAEFFAADKPSSNNAKMINDEIFIVYNLDKIMPERTKTLDEVKGIVTNIIMSDKKKAMMEQLAKDTYFALVHKQNVAGSEKNFQLVKDQKVSRNSEDYSMDYIEQILAANIGDYVEPFYNSDTNEFYITYINNKSEIAVDKYEIEQIRSEIARDMNSTINNSMMASYLAYLKNKIPVVIKIQ